uniref:DNL-type domain-containing protein n=2 Tax=Oryza TaxID=4527 RepID=A0A0E0MZ08_ORYRU
MAASGELRRTVGDPGRGRPQIGAQREHVRSLPAASTATSSGGHNGKGLPPPPRLRPAIASSRVSFRRGFLEARGGKKLRVSCLRRILAVSACSGEADSDAGAAPAESTFDLNLPRRSLLVQFTCNACGERTKRLINRVAYERGTIFLQCAGCQVYHKFVDNLGLVVEYDLREENGMNTDTET